MTYYKFLRLVDGQVISDWDYSVWERNEWRDIDAAPVLQAAGFYTCERIGDAVQWPGNVLAEVEVRGRSATGTVMSAHQGMRIVRAWKFASADWVGLAVHAAYLVLPIFESRFPDDDRPRLAIVRGTAAEAADAADAAGRAAEIGARSAAYAARAAVAAADAMTRRADAAAYAGQAVKSADGASHGISPDVRAEVRDGVEGWLQGRIPGLAPLW